MTLDSDIVKIENVQEGRNIHRGKTYFLWLYEVGESKGIDENCPCLSRVGPITSGNPAQALGIRMWKGVPEKFIPILVAHEMRHADGYNHEEAARYHIQYAKKFLPEADYKEFLEWQSQFEWYQENGVE